METTLEIYVLVKGDVIDTIAEQIIDMAESGALLKEIIGTDDIFYLFDKNINVTFIRFHGQSWAIPAAGFLDLLERKGIPFTVDANKGVPYVLLRQPSEEIINQEGKTTLPPMGNIDRVINYADLLHNQQTVEKTALALEDMVANE